MGVNKYFTKLSSSASCAGVEEDGNHCRGGGDVGNHCKNSGDVSTFAHYSGSSVSLGELESPSKGGNSVMFPIRYAD